ERVSITHLVGRAAALALAGMPTVNGRIAFGRYRPHDSVDVSFLVALDEGMDLGKAKIERADQKSVAEIARELRERAERLRSGNDAGFEKSKPLLRLLPTWLIRPVLWATGWLTGSLGVSVGALGLARYQGGTLARIIRDVFADPAAFDSPARTSEPDHRPTSRAGLRGD